MGNWNLNDIPWDNFDKSLLNSNLLNVVKAACMVEYHSEDYTKYLCGVFHDDPGFCSDAQKWGVEEVQHGKALRRYAEIADPNFNFNSTYARFVENHKINTQAQESIRGSRCNELVARCVVEVGTSAYYSALKDATEEPVLKEIFRNIAADEFRHYKLFYTNMKRYQKQEGVSRIGRFIAAFKRLIEAGDDELSYAYYCAIETSAPYNKSTYSNAYASQVFPHYRYQHVKRGLGMIMKVIGIKPWGIIGKVITAICWLTFQGYTGYTSSAAKKAS